MKTKHIVGEIKWPIYIKWVNSMQYFCVIDAFYNVTLGRPKIHGMKAVPSTYHHCVMMPTPWGTVKIISDQQEFKECYNTSMKSSTVPQQA